MSKEVSLQAQYIHSAVGSELSRIRAFVNRQPPERLDQFLSLATGRLRTPGISPEERLEKYKIFRLLARRFWRESGYQGIVPVREEFLPNFVLRRERARERQALKAKLAVVEGRFGIWSAVVNAKEDGLEGLPPELLVRMREFYRLNAGSLNGGNPDHAEQLFWEEVHQAMAHFSNYDPMEQAENPIPQQAADLGRLRKKAHELKVRLNYPQDFHHHAVPKVFPNGAH